MTPAEYVDRLGQLIAAGKDWEALDLASQVGGELLPKLTREELMHVLGMMESAQLAVDLLDAERAGRDGAEPTSHQPGAGSATPLRASPGTRR